MIKRLPMHPPWDEHPPGDECSDLSEHPRQVADREGWTMAEPQEDELFLDIDNDDSAEVYHQIVATLRQFFHVEQSNITVSPGGNTHVYLRVPGQTFTPLERVALQACLGSDRKRELFSFLRIRLKMERPPTVFFEVPDAE